MSTKLNITLKLAGKEYSLNIEREKEEKYRRAEREINVLVEKFKSHFRGQPEDYLALAALQLAVSNIDTEMSRSLGDDLDSLTEMDRELDNYLNSLK